MALELLLPAVEEIDVEQTRMTALKQDHKKIPFTAYLGKENTGYRINPCSGV